MTRWRRGYRYPLLAARKKKDEKKLHSKAIYTTRLGSIKLEILFLGSLYLFACEDSTGKIARQQHRDSSQRERQCKALSCGNPYFIPIFQIYSRSVANLPEDFH